MAMGITHHAIEGQRNWIQAAVEVQNQGRPTAND